MKKLLVLFFLAPLLVAGCAGMNVEFRFKENHTYDTRVEIVADEALAGDEASIRAWQIAYVFPIISHLYRRETSSYEEDYSTYVVHSFSAENLSLDHLKDNPLLRFFQGEGGEFVFESTIPQIVKEVTEENKDEVILTLTVVMPREIDIANTTSVQENTATWKITREMLTKGVTFKAMTK